MHLHIFARTFFMLGVTCARVEFNFVNPHILISIIIIIIITIIIKNSELANNFLLRLSL